MSRSITRWRSKATFIGALLIVASSSAQQQPEFDVATVKRSPPPSGNTIDINLGAARNGKVTLGNATLADCIKFAYGLSAASQLTGPDWINSLPRFDIVGQAPPDTPRDRLLLMLQTLLADRVKLRIHKEQ